MPVDLPVPDPATRLHLARLDAALDALARGLTRLIEPAEAADSLPTSLDPPTDAGLSVPAGERPASANDGVAATYGRSA